MQLESMTGSHIPLAQLIQWTPDQEAAFYAAREATVPGQRAGVCLACSYHCLEVSLLIGQC